MAVFKHPADFVNQNVALLRDRQSSMYSIFLESKPTFTTYYHVNKIRSRTDKGLKMPEKLNGALSPIRYNKLIGFPLYGIEQIQLQLEEEDEGLTSDYSGEALILPNTIHPTPDDYFIINYLEKKYMFRITNYAYDTIKSNNYYKIEYTIQSVDIDFFNDIERQVVKTYYTQFENIGTDDKVFLTEEAKLDSDKISALYDAVAQDYLDMFYRPMSDPYNTLLFTRESTSWNSDYDYIFDQNLVAFCNKHQLFYKENSTDSLQLYEEPRKYFYMDYKNSIYDRLEHKEKDTLDSICNYFSLEPTVSMDSIFMYYRDKRPKYLRAYRGSTNYYGGTNEEYIPSSFVSNINNETTDQITDPIDKFIAYWLTDNTGDDNKNLMDLLDNISKYHNRYTFHNFIFIPLFLYCLMNLYNTIANSGEDNIDGIADELGNEMGIENV